MVASRSHRTLAALAVAAALLGGGAVVGEQALRGGALDRVLGLPPLDLGPAEKLSTLVVDKDGTLLRPFVTDDGRWRLALTPDAVDPLYLQLLYAYEDRRFPTHAGVDWSGMLRAAGQVIRHGRVVSGGSTLTMQVARLLEPRDVRDIPAKLRQIARAFELERRLSKDEILSLYLRLAPYGGNIEGGRAASFAYFGKEPRRLDLAEAALLVALPQSPELRRPDRRPDAARKARDRVLDRAVARGLVTAHEAAQARKAPVPTERLPFPMLAPHLAEKLVADNPGLATVRTTLDARLQASLQALAKARMAGLPATVSTAIVAVDNRTGAVRAEVGGADYFDTARAGGVDLARALRSPGSALKPFIYGLAFEDGVAHPETLLDDRPTRYGAWAPENFDDTFHGTVTARQALQQSLNLPAVDLLDAVGPARLIARLKAAGAVIELPRDTPIGLAVGLGGLGIRPLDMAKLYAGLARGGDTLPLVERLDGAATEPARNLLQPVPAWYVADILKGVSPPENGLARRIAFKTGTSYGYRDAWAAGFDRRWTVVVWVGRPDNLPVPGLVGRQVAAPILFDAFARLGTAPQDVVKPPGTLAATSATLPPPLRHIRKDAPKSLAGAAAPSLAISFPPDGARVDLGLAKLGREEAGPLVMKALGGTQPLTWMVNGLPLAAEPGRRDAEWQPDGAGFARVTVMDASGRVATARFRVD
jgi:penicillin-binding protein 1C